MNRRRKRNRKKQPGAVVAGSRARRHDQRLISSGTEKAVAADAEETTDGTAEPSIDLTAEASAGADAEDSVIEVEESSADGHVQESVAPDTEESPDATPKDASMLRIIAGKVLPPIGRFFRCGTASFATILLYCLMFCVVTATCVLVIQYGAYTSDQATQTAAFVAKMWTDGQFQFLFNCLILGCVYAFLVFLTNRFWVATPLFIILAVVAATANRIRVSLRNEPLMPADFSFLQGGGMGRLASFIPEEAQTIIHRTVVALIIVVLVCMVFYVLDRRRAVIPMRTRKAVMISLRIVLTIIPAVALFITGAGLGSTGSWVQIFAADVFSDTPKLWNSIDDARTNGPVVNFVRLLHTKAMDKPEGYGEEAMKDIAARYRRAADAINQRRTANLTDSTVILILSESFADPTRVPGVSLTEDPMPNIRAIKQNTTSGLMLSSGYGGGTANLEYQALSGLNMGNFDGSLAVAYQQLVPDLKWTPTFNQLWNDAHGADGSEAFHPYDRNLYFRDINYRKFKFHTFWSNGGKYEMKHLGGAGVNGYTSDAEFYQDLLEAVDQAKTPQFLQAVTMQNHLPYLENNYYDNQFVAADQSDLPETERQQLETYAKGVSLTDQATADFLTALDAIDKPITVVFYGDHLPGFYETANKDLANAQVLHETDYFIWSNQATGLNGTMVDPALAAYSSPNYFLPLTAAHLNAKVSPFMAMLTELERRIPAMSTAAATGKDNGASYLDAQGQEIDAASLSGEAKQLLADYRMVQYDMTVGKQYLRDMDFVSLP